MGVWCDRCDRSFPHSQALYQHLTNASIHNYCSRCERDFVSGIALQQHKKMSSNHWICGECRADCFSADDLDDHIEQCHWYCSPCHLFVANADMLQQHYCQSSAHHYCGPCKREFNSAQNLHAHLRSTKHVGQTIKCIGCTRFFPTLSAMTIHLESGTCVSGITRQVINNEIRARDTNHLITDRLLTYPDSNGRVDNWATDAAWNGRKYECYFCPREFRTLADLNRHLQSPVHEQSIYHCPHCTTKFKLFSGLVQHVESESCGIARFRDVKMAMDRLISNATRRIAY